MAQLRAFENNISLLSYYFMPVVIIEPFFAYWTGVVTLQPDLETRKTKQVTTFR